ncbi:TonB-linked SusC/RagA family outer membrane protein [Pedobacter africanus]|uniref:TonB-linked SusC/RagA family outer membrane protein n=1 Tax=Pedobacter africanus TaxID=151894 RepID=A0ACC6KXA2_9SPHI|nr:SusC/RagA family TonB-linked outer membrane protein [Pedobacter africanus]MDR6783780.1 TonB-linked SusC/RagA family outer membrane protein [Pedobacter africanus]
MRLTTLILITAILQVSANTFAQKITLSEKNAPIVKIFEKIRTQSGYDFMFSLSTINEAKPVNINVQNAELKDVLKQIFVNQPLEYKINEKSVVISPKESSLLDKLSTVISNIVRDLTVKGRVVDQEGKPLPNASIRIKGKSAVTNTNQNGEFEIKDVADNAVLLISYVGYKQLEISLKDAVMPLEIKLNVVTGELEEVKVTYNTGYQNIPKERATGSFVQVDKELLNRTVSTNILDRIPYVVSGLRKEFEGSFSPNNNSSDISIRGLSTINANRTPLIVIDGFPYEEQGQLSGITVLNNLNPNDVESITILRDAAAASIWGARSANGVIVIQTKRGKLNQDTKVEVSSNIKVVNRPDLFRANLASSADVIDMEKKLFATGMYNDYDDLYPSLNYFPVASPVIEILLAQRRGDLSAESANAKLEALSKHDVRNDMLKYLIRPEINQQYNLNISGGSNKTSYYGSIGYDKNREQNVGNDMNRLTLNFNNMYQPFKNIRIRTFINYIQGKRIITPVDPLQYLSTGQTLAPSYTQFKDDNGNFLYISPLFDGLRQAYIDTVSTKGLLDWHYNPIQEINAADNTDKSSAARFGGGFTYIILSGLDLDFNGQYERSLIEGRNYMGTETYYNRNMINKFMFLDSSGQPQYPVPMGGILDASNSTQTAYNLRGQLNFNRDFSRHSISGFFGAELRQTDFITSAYRQYGYDPGKLLFAMHMDYKNTYTTRPSLAEESIGSGLSSRGTLNRFVSYYANGAYTFNSRYTLTASARNDGSNFFGVNANQRFRPQWSVGAAWDITKEHFFKPGIISSLKIRATYGYNGNLDNRIATRPIIDYAQGQFAYNNRIPFAYVKLGNPGVTWEKVSVANLGVDFALLKGRLSGVLEYYRKRTDNLIGTVMADPTTGASNGGGIASFIGNVAGLKSQGFDLRLSGLITEGKVKIQSSINLSYNKDQLTSYNFPGTNGTEPPASSIIFGGIKVGRPLNGMYSYRWAGLNPENGDPMGYLSGKKVPYTTIMGYDADYSPNTKPDDLIYHGVQSPAYFGNMINTISYKGLSLSFNINYGFGFYFRRASIDYSTLQVNLSGHGDYALRWQNPGDELKTNVPSYGVDSRNEFYLNSEVLVEKGDFIYLRDLNLTYTFHKQLTKIGLRSARLFANINNLGLIWTANNKHLDPQAGRYNIGVRREIAFGINLTF